jgi:radical SAM protein with 4Fe4S-binding SPASM domain
MHDSPTYKNEITNELSKDDCLKVIDNFSNMLDTYKIPGRINFTGGDPLLKEGIFDLVNYAINKGIKVEFLGNPDKIDYKMAKRLKAAGICRYQISLDGLEETHDTLRGKKGAFKDALRALRILRDACISTVVMFTLSKANDNDLIEVIRLVAKKGVSTFDFARLAPIGSGSGMSDQILSPLKYKQILLNVFDEYRRLKESGCSTHFGRKDHLWKLLYSELGLFRFPDNFNSSDIIYSGCGIGINLLVVLADGTVLPCRRLPIPIGNVQKNSLRDIFIYSNKLNELRNEDLLEKCRDCDLLRLCRGCPAVSYGIYGRWTAPDPQCWKKVEK